MNLFTKLFIKVWNLGYCVIYNRRFKRKIEPLSQTTLDEIEAYGKRWDDLRTEILTVEQSKHKYYADRN